MVVRLPRLQSEIQESEFTALNSVDTYTTYKHHVLFCGLYVWDLFSISLLITKELELRYLPSSLYNPHQNLFKTNKPVYKKMKQCRITGT